MALSSPLRSAGRAVRSVPSEAGSRERLLAAGALQLRTAGARTLTVRGTAAAAGVNLGSFVHHFGSREAFISNLIEGMYAPLFNQLQLKVAAEVDVVVRLRDAVLTVVTWIAEHRQSLVQLLLDAAAGEAAALRFLRSLDQRHPALLLQLIEDALQQRRLCRADPHQHLLFLMSSMALPTLLLNVVSERGLAPARLVRALDALAVDPAAIEQRLDWALRGLAPQEAS